MERAVAIRDVPGSLGVSEAYDLSAPFYDDWKWQRFWRTTESPIVLDYLDRFLRPRAGGGGILDVGCGTGWYLSKLRRTGAEATGVDISAGMLDVARHASPRAQFHQADARALPFDSGRFEAILCTRVLTHIPDARPAIDEMARVLGPDGTMVISSIDANHPYERTRLPVGAGHIATDTFKHRRVDIGDYIKSLGFIDQFTIHIAPGGGEPPVSWLTAWRR